MNKTTNASGTAALGGSIIDIKPRKRRFLVGKFSFSASNLYPLGYWFIGKRKSQKPKTRSPKLPNSMYAFWNSFRQTIKIIA